MYEFMMKVLCLFDFTVASVDFIQTPAVETYLGLFGLGFHQMNR